jgi:hypothetical protein
VTSEINPIFIIGSPRSGTTLLRFMLSSHPDIFIPDETGFIPHLVKPDHIEDTLSLKEVISLLDRIGKLNYQWYDLVDDIPAFYQNLVSPNLMYVLDTLFRQIIANQNAIRWGDKTPLYVRHITLISMIYPHAQFIHVIRDGRDATLSAQRKWGVSKYWYMDNYYLLQNWVTNVTMGRRDGTRLPKSQYFELRYEQLVQDPENNLHQICQFLGETYHPKMVNHNNLALQVGPGPDQHTEVMQPISTSSVGRWYSEMSVFDKKMTDHLAGHLLLELGYERPAVEQFTTQEYFRLKYLAGKYNIVKLIQNSLYKTGFLTLNRNMRRPPS